MNEPGFYPEWQPKAWRVQLEDHDTGARWWHPIAAAVGPFDARNQAKVDYPGCTPLRAQPFLCDGCGHPANSHDVNSGRCSVTHTAGDETYSCECTAGYAPGRSPERLYPGEKRPEPFQVDLLPPDAFLDALDHVDAEAKEWLVDRRPFPIQQQAAGFVPPAQPPAEPT